MTMEYDYYEDDICHGCKYAKIKKEGTYGLFSRRYGCICGQRTDFAKRGDEAVEYIKNGDFRKAIEILHGIQEDRRCFDVHGWIEPYDTTVLCPFKNHVDFEEAYESRFHRDYEGCRRTKHEAAASSARR